jgi:hypothetical protein
VLSWICAFGSLLVAWLWAKGPHARKPALWLSAAMQFPWAVMAWRAHQSGAVFCAAAFLAIDIWGLWRAYGRKREV